MIKQLLYLLCVVLFSGIAALGIYRLLTTAPSAVVEEQFEIDTITRATYNELITSNVLFAQADWALRKKEYAEAQTLYLQALDEVEVPYQQAYIKWLFARTLDRQERPAEAIRVYKDIAADESYPNNMRARAVQSMGELVHRFGDTEMHHIVFTGEPYAAMAIDAGANLALRRLSEYAVSFYPLALSELRIAEYYTRSLRNPGKDEALESGASDLRDYKTRIQAALARADADIQRMTLAASPDYELLAETLAAKGRVLDKLARVGEVPGRSAEAAFLSALDFYGRADTYGSESADSMTRFWYALYLTRSFFDGKRKGDIRTLLAPFSTNPSYADSVAARFFQSELAKNNYGEGMFLLTQADPQYRKFLSSLGLSEADFKNVGGDE